MVAFVHRHELAAYCLIRSIKQPHETDITTIPIFRWRQVRTCWRSLSCYVVQDTNPALWPPRPCSSHQNLETWKKHCLGVGSLASCSRAEPAFVSSNKAAGYDWLTLIWNSQLESWTSTLNVGPPVRTHSHGVAETLARLWSSCPSQDSYYTNAIGIWEDGRVLGSQAGALERK